MVAEQSIKIKLIIDLEFLHLHLIHLHTTNSITVCAFNKVTNYPKKQWFHQKLLWQTDKEEIHVKITTDIFSLRNTSNFYKKHIFFKKYSSVLDGKLRTGYKCEIKYKYLGGMEIKK